MTEAGNQGKQDSTANQEPQVRFSVERIYVKDISFETPMGVEAFKRQVKPEVNQEIGTRVNKVEDNVYEVILTVTVKVGNKDTDGVIYLCEVQQAGLFYVSGVDNNQLTPILNSHCPSILFPYAREAIDAMIIKGSFPALMLPPINFDALYQQAISQARAKSGNGENAPATH